MNGIVEKTPNPFCCGDLIISDKVTRPYGNVWHQLPDGQ